MTHPNRVQPDGEFLAIDARGMLMGNRGILHDGSGAALPKRWAHQAWVCCALSFKGRRRTLRKAGRYTELFFLDEAVALAAGHRPCGECRRADYSAFADSWTRAFGAWPGPKTADAQLHEARALRGGRKMKRHLMEAATLANGTMFEADSAVFIRWNDQAYAYAPDGYGRATPLLDGKVTALTNPVTQAVLHAGYKPSLHPSIAVS